MPLQTFQQISCNAFLHFRDAFGGKPRRFRDVFADCNGHLSELLVKATAGGYLDELVSAEDRDALIGSLDAWGALDKDHAYVESLETSARRGYDRPCGVAVAARPTGSSWAAGPAGGRSSGTGSSSTLSRDSEAT